MPIVWVSAVYNGPHPLYTILQKSSYLLHKVRHIVHVWIVSAIIRQGAITLAIMRLEPHTDSAEHKSI